MQKVLEMGGVEKVRGYFRDVMTWAKTRPKLRKYVGR